MKKKILSIILSTIMAGSLCADMTVLASEPTEVSELAIEEQTEILSEIPEQNNVQEKERNETITQETPLGGQFGDNDEFYWELEHGVLTISGKGAIESMGIPHWADYSDQINKIVIEEGITTIETSILRGSSVTEILLPASTTSLYYGDTWTWDGEGHEHGYLFPFIGKKLEKITVASGNNNYISVDGVLYSKDQTRLICFPCAREGVFKIPEGVKELGYGPYTAFISSQLSSITIPEGVTNIKGFRNCTNLTSIILPGSVNNIGDGFGDSTNLTSITILNKSLSLYDYHSIRKEATINGYSGSTAEAFAKENGNRFVPLNSGNTEDKTVINIASIKISGNSNKIAAGKKVRLTANVMPANATNKAVTWTSGNTKVATVNNSGTVSMNKKAGGKSVIITATAQDGSGIKATYKITAMKGVVKKVAISGKKTLKAGKTLKLKAKVTATKKANKKLKWTSSNTKYATVDSSGKVKALKAGKSKRVKITAEATDGSGKKKSVTIKIK